MEFKEQLYSIKEKFETLKAKDSKQQVFCAQEHAYKLNPPLTQAEVNNFEKHYQIQLPEDYKAFLTLFANGGAGPSIGIMPLEEAVPAHLSPHLPFPYWKEQKVIYEEGQTTAQLQELNQFYHNPEIDYGKILLCDYGCGIFIHLIVKGQAYGQVWMDNRTWEYGGLFPFDEYANTSPVGFLDWYELWLDESLHEING